MVKHLITLIEISEKLDHLMFKNVCLNVNWFGCDFALVVL